MTSKKILKDINDNIDPSLFEHAEYDDSKRDIQTIHFGDPQSRFS